MPHHTLTTTAVVAVLALAGGVITGRATSQPADDTTAAPTPADMLAEMTKAAEPDARHAQLAKMAGDWNCEMKFWLTPDAPPDVSKGRSVNRMILDGRILETRFLGELSLAGEALPFAGLGLIGFDKPRARYFSFWSDTISTSATMLTGPESGGTLTLQGKSAGMAGEHTLRQTYRWTGDNTYVLEFWEPDHDTGEYVRTGEITYTRGG